MLICHPCYVTAHKDHKVTHISTAKVLKCQGRVKRDSPLFDFGVFKTVVNGEVFNPMDQPTIKILNRNKITLNQSILCTKYDDVGESFKFDIPILRKTDYSFDPNNEDEVIKSVIRLKILDSGLDNDLTFGFSNMITTELSGSYIPGVDVDSFGFFCKTGELMFNLNGNNGNNGSFFKCSAGDTISFYLSNMGNVSQFIVLNLTKGLLLCQREVLHRRGIGVPWGGAVLLDVPRREGDQGRAA